LTTIPLLAISGPPTLALSGGVSGAAGEVAALGLSDGDADVTGLAVLAALAVAAAAFVAGPASAASPEIAAKAAMTARFRRTSDFIGVPLISA
jgi:hypothetical protein